MLIVGLEKVSQFGEDRPGTRGREGTPSLINIFKK